MTTAVAGTYRYSMTHTKIDIYEFEEKGRQVDGNDKKPNE